IFLDEIGGVGVAPPVTLLRGIQEQEVRRVGGTGSIKVDVRIIAATNRDLANLVKEGRFREDLFYRLNVVRIGLPPLRERREDIPVLAHHFFQKFSRGSTRPITGFVPGTLALLQRYHWPGNVRELENAIERAVSLSHGPLVLPDDLPEAIRNAGAGSSEDTVGRGLGKEEALLTLDEVEKRHLMSVLRETGGNKARAAKTLGIDRRTLYRMVERFGLEMGEGADESGLSTED